MTQELPPNIVALAEISEAQSDSHQKLVCALELLSNLKADLQADVSRAFTDEYLSAFAIVKKGSHRDWCKLKIILKEHKLVRDVEQALKSIASDSTDREDRATYDVIAGCLQHFRNSDSGSYWAPLCNFDARIACEEIRDDGADQAAEFLIEGTLATGRELLPARVPVTQFANMGWVLNNWGVQAVVYAGQGCKDNLRVAIQTRSTDVERRTIYTHVGWRYLDGEWGYLTHGGPIGPNGPLPDIEVELGDSRAKHYSLPAPPTTPEQIKRAVRASLLFLEVAPDEITVPLLCGAFRAPLSEVQAVDFSIFCAGSTGSQKTELSTLAQAHYGAGFNSRSLPGNWTSTENALEKLAFIAKDSVLVIDDFVATGSTIDAQRLHAKADRVLRAQGNRGGRGRMYSDGRLRPEYYPRGLIVSSGEDIPRGHSLRSRALIVQFPPKCVDLTCLTTLQQHANNGLLAESMSGYIQWLAPQLTTLKEEVTERFEQLRTHARQTIFAHDRTPEIIASLGYGWETFLRYALEVNAIDSTEHDALTARGWNALHQVGQKQAALFASEDHTTRFLTLVQSVLSSGAAHVVDTSGKQPLYPSEHGWQRNSLESSEWRPQGTKIGWIDGSDLYLDPNAAFAAVQRLAQSQGTPITTALETLSLRLKEGGHLLSYEPGRTTIRKSLEGSRPRVLHITLTPPTTSGPSGPIEPGNLLAEDIAQQLLTSAFDARELPMEDRT